MYCEPRAAVQGFEPISESITSIRLIYPPSLWPTEDRLAWETALSGKGVNDEDNPAANWSPRTAKKVADSYGRYISWLCRNKILIFDETHCERITPERVKLYVADLKLTLAPVSVGMMVGGLVQAANAFRPNNDWQWLSIRFSRLKNRAKPSRNKMAAIRPTLDIYEFGVSLMKQANASELTDIRKAVLYQTGLIIALLAARPLRIRNFQALVIGQSLKYANGEYRLVFSTNETKTGAPIDEPIPNALTPYLERYLQVHRNNLLQDKSKRPSENSHKRLWVDISGNLMREAALRTRIETYTRQHFGVAIWPHLFRDCLLTTLSVEQPEMIKNGQILLGHASPVTGEKYYNHAGMMEATRKYTATILELRTSFINDLLASSDT